MPYYLYILRSESSGQSYIGQTSSIDKRLQEHNSGKNLSTRNRGPWKLIYSEEFQTRTDAVRQERYYKTAGGRLELKAKGLLK